MLLEFALLIAVFGAAVYFAFNPAIGIVIGVVGLAYGLFSYFGAGGLVASVAHANPSPRRSSRRSCAPWRTSSSPPASTARRPST